MTVSLALKIIGSDDEPRWVTGVTYGSGPACGYGNCCEGGHESPDEAAAHGGLLAVTWMGRQARALRSPAIGALALAKAVA